MLTRIHPNTVHILNSKITQWYFPKISSDLGSGSRYFKQFVELLPLPKSSNNQEFYDKLTPDNVDTMLIAFYNLEKNEVRVMDL